MDATSQAEVRLGHGLAGLGKRYQAYLALGRANTTETQLSRERHAGRTLANLPAWEGQEAYLEATLAYSSNLLFPTSYAPEDGTALAASWRYSGLGQELTGQRLLLRGSQTISLWPSQGHQIVAGGLVGWVSENATRTLQGRFHIGAPSTLQVPRGYRETTAVGEFIQGWSLAYRLPLWRPFSGFSTTPFVFRQIVLEAFLDGAKVTTEHLRAKAPWYRSAGGELHAEWEVWALRFSPGLGVARQLDGLEETVAYLTLGFTW